MSTISRKETERRLRKMARAYVDMKYATYEWPEGQNPLDGSGAPRVSRQELLRCGDYSVNYKQRGKALFEDPYFKQQVALEYARREQAFQLAAPSVNQTLLTGSALMAEISVRATVDPGSFSNEQLLKYAPAIYNAGLELEARKAAGEAKRPDPQDVRAIFARGVIMQPDQRKELADGLSETADGRRQGLADLIEAANAIDAGGDAPESD